MSSGGHIRKRGKGSWEIKLELDRDAAGKRQTRYHSFRGTRKQAQQKLTELLSEANRGVYTNPSPETLGEFLKRWTRDWGSMNVSAKTLERYRGLVDHQIVPHLGNVPVQKIRPVDLVALYSKLLRIGAVDGGPLSARTVNHVHRLLRNALGRAMQWGLIAVNPTAAAEPPRVLSGEMEILRQDQITALLQALQNRNDRFLFTLGTVALGTGLRRGELLALRWADVDLEAGKLQVERTLEVTKAAGLRFKAPKTRHGRRTVSLPSSVVAELRIHWKAQQEQRLALGLGRAALEDLVFAAWDGGPRQPDSVSDAWLAVTAALGLRCGLHSLRHAHASALIAAGVDVVILSRRLGHGSPAITLSVYAHLFSGADDKAAVAAETLFTRLP
jgi:integrase